MEAGECGGALHHMGQPQLTKETDPNNWVHLKYFVGVKCLGLM